MQLSRLEIRGFKSFGDKVVVNFDDGITGIVGPNGCGKSNIVDSIRWVLGEQKTRALRSEKMENIIFNGTKNRKPLQMAEVSLTFNNTKNLLPTEYSTVTITRRYYRSGESEYQLNGVTCRLKDITNLFLDTGIGSDSYAIIELKMVDDILNDKDNSRRNLFEEAAGISKFKVRKKQTLKKLQETDKDLERVEDILFEIEKNLKSLERQAKQAEKYTKVKEEYKLLSIELAKLSLSSFREELNKLEEKVKNESELKESFNSKIKEHEAEIEKFKNELVQKEKLLASRQKTLNEHINNIRQYESDKKIKNERQRFLKDKTESLGEQIETDRENAEVIYSEIKQLLETREEAIQTTNDLERSLQDLETERNNQKEQTTVLQEQINVQNSQYRLKQEQQYELQKSLEINESRFNNLKQEVEEMSSDSDTQTESISLLEKRVKETVTLVDIKNDELEKLKKEEKEIEQHIQSKEEDINAIKDDLVILNRTIDSKQNEYNLTKSLVDNLEGFPEAIKFLKKNSHWGEEAHLLSDVLTCPEEYRISIENFLEPFMNFYVVDNDSQAYQAVNLLSKSAKGKANFFVLKNFDNFNGVDQKSIEGAVCAINIVEFDPKYSRLIQYILNDVYIVLGESDNVPENRSETFISQTGKIVKRSYSISGGSVGLFEGKRIGRIKNLEKLHDQIKELSDQREAIKLLLDKQQQELTRIKNIDIKNRIENQQKSIADTNEAYISLKLKEEQLHELIKNNALKREDLLKNMKILEDGINKSKPKVELEAVHIEDLLQQINQLNEELQLQNELLTQKANAYNQENIQLHQQKNRVESLSQEVSFKEQNLEKNRERVAKNAEELVKTEKEIQKILVKTDVSDDDLLDLYKEKENIEIGVNEVEKDYYATRTKIDEKEQELRETQRKQDGASQSILDVKTLINDKKLSLSSTQERLKVEFEIDINQLLIDNEKDSEITISYSDANDLNGQIIKSKEKINKMGPINPMAIEAYEEIKKRYDFITDQKQDLSESKDSLMATIKEIDTVAKENFSHSFNEIKENFIKVFRSLFTDEDTCDLVLADPSLPLESAIDIIAKPKGKRPLTINQLSGGEKTLTAVALLFAIYLIKPAPFCIFDEVDAPLDDANIDKFNNIIREFSNDSQFILVTHNKRTMSTTDVIYGVTMQEVGVSRLVPVDLREIDEYVQTT